MKNPLISAGIETATFRFAAQRLNHCATAVPSIIEGEGTKSGMTQSESIFITTVYP